MSGKLSRTVLRRGKGSNPFSLAEYTAFAFRKLLNTLNIAQSFSPKGNPYNNSVMESFFSSLKSEELYRLNYRSIRDFHQHLDRSIHKYNNERPHATLFYKTPNAFEKAFYDELD